MKNINEYIIEASEKQRLNKIHSSWSKVVKKLSEEDKEWVKTLANDSSKNQIYTMEELEQRCWNGDLKDTWNDEYLYMIDHILTRDNGITQKDVIDTYSLATSGKQSMIEVFAQTLYMINREL